MSDYNLYNFTVKAADLLKVLQNAIDCGCTPLVEINGMYYEIDMSKPEKEEKPQAAWKDLLSERITEACFDFDPYNGSDREDLTKFNGKALETLSGCYGIISELCDMVTEAVRT